MNPAAVPTGSGPAGGLARAGDAPRVSVVIPTYNRADRVIQAAGSVLAQTYLDFELIVVDDGSTDHTAEALAGLGPDVRAIRQPHAGVSAARNRGIRTSRGDLIAFLDSDDLWLPEKLAVQTEFFDQNPEVLIAQTEETWVRDGRRVNPKTRHQKPSGDIFIPSLDLCLVSPSAVMIRRRLFDEVGLFDETLPACEDYDLWLRVSARYPVYLLPNPLIVKQGGHPDQLSRTTPGLDQYRVRGIEKILAQGVLSPEKKQAALLMLAQKARVYGQGCLKRGRLAEAGAFMEKADEAERMALAG